ncbi:MAG: CPBP family intramembrane glutamic endopeptidase [Bacteroidota bacterium]
MKKLLSDNKWWFYFVLTSLISWPIWWLGRVLLPENLTTVTLILGAFGPFAAAIIILRITEGVSGLKNWLKTTFNFRVNIIWYLLGGIILPFFIAGAHHIIYLAFGGKSGLVLSADWLAYFAFLISTTLLTGGNEEPGWRGYITTVLMDRFHPVVTCTITGIGWALWHAPMYFLEGWGGNDQPFVWLLIYCIPLSMILTWLYFKSKKSIIPVMLMHAGTNVVFQYFPMESKVFDSVADEFTVIKTIVYILLVIFLLIKTKGTLGYKKTLPVN